MSVSYLATLKQVPDGGYEDAQGIFHRDAESALCALLGFCGCGAPDAALKYVRNALRLLAMKGPDGMEAWQRWYREVLRPATDALFHNDVGAEYLMWFLLDAKGLTEHGSSVPGWLTELGDKVLTDLETFDFDDAPSVEVDA